MKNPLRRGILLALAVCLLLGAAGLLTACDPTYYQGSADENALVTVAIRSLPGCFAGHGSTGVQKLDEDDYGRVLFIYHEDSLLDKNMVALCILQKTESGGFAKRDRVYYLRGRNVLLATTEDLSVNLEKAKSLFFEEEINAFKAANDWNESTFDDYMASSEIRSDFSIKEAGDVPRDTFEADFGHNKNISCRPMFKTDDGRLVYTVEKWTEQPNGKHDVAGVYLILLNHKHEVDTKSLANMIELTGVENFTEEFAEFLEKNGIS